MSDILEQQFRAALDDVAVTPPNGMWDRIDAGLTTRRIRRQRLRICSSVAAAAVVLFFVGLWWPASDTVLPDHSLSSTLPVAATETKQEAEPLPLEELTTVTVITTPKERQQPLAQVTDSPDPERLVQTTDHVPATLAYSLPDDYIPLTSKGAIQNLIAYNKLRGIDRAGVVAATSAPVRKPEKSKPQKPQKPARVSYSMGGYISPAYATGDFGSDGESALARVYDRDQLSGIFSVNGGLSFAVNTGKRLSLETGIGYSRIGQKTSNASVYIPVQASEEFVENTEVLTPLGSLRSNKQNAVVTIIDKYTEVLHDVRNESLGTIEQQFGTLDIPLHLRYFLNEKQRVRVSVSGGLNANIVVDNRSYLSYNGSKENIGKTEDIRPFNLSTHLGLGVEYPITSAVSFRFEPGFRYYLQSISRNDDINFKPYSFTLATGIGIHF